MNSTGDGRFTQPIMFASPRLAWELIERIISHSGDDRRTLYSFSLTCHQLRPRSLCLMVADVDIMDRAQVITFRDFLEAYPHFCPFVYSIKADPTTFMPFPLLYILPNLTNTQWSSPATPQPLGGLSLPLPLLTCCHKFGTNITSLSLVSLSSKTTQELCRVLLAFTAIKDLRCERLGIGGTVANGAVLEQRLRSQRLKLRNINIGYNVHETATKFLFDSAQSTVEILSLDITYSIISGPSALLCGKWPELLTLTLTVSTNQDRFEALIKISKEFHPSRLNEVSVELRSTVGDLLSWIGSDEGNLHLCSELDQTLLSYRHPQLLPFGHRRTRSGRKDLWSEEFAKYFPKLTERGLLKIASSADIALGHDDLVTALVYSPDGSRLATASRDCTIILWDSDGQLVHEWVAHTGSVRSLAFSPDSRHLASGSWDRMIAIWDVGQGSRKITTLKGHTEQVEHCAWSPDGTLIVSGSWDNTVRLWDTRTFQQLHLLDISTNDFYHAYFSFDGRWLILIGSHRCRVWDVGRGAMHINFRIAEGEETEDKAAIDEENEEDKGEGDEEDKDEKDEKDEDARPQCCAAALNLQGTCLATGYVDGSVRIWDVQTGQCLVFSRMHTRRVTVVAFSSDGTRILSTSWGDTPKILDTYSGTMILSLEGHTGGVGAACFSPCGKYVASASSDETVRLWRTDDGSCMGIFSEHKDAVWLSAFSPDGKTLSSGANDGSVVMRHIRDIIPVEDTSV
ncbi:quinon protein alcohol dehydrogenase-like superfamily [Dichomitus squalens]|uniref:Quinon protein alcohol dehydrogenase-like superfamily n=1 Tax=Dichomitus squalens TaxID=114155 RepID=A0A4Q9PLI5_9APHY|nr:quinon protein alcohol dehydrogenase-like superfamily [Dichomitus squalens]